jgi:UDP:flavonoid glycosyltransferase YjiC (YdhE family)
LPPDSPSYFAYLDAEAPGVEVILAGLLRSGVPGQAFLKNLPLALQKKLKRPGLEIFSRPPLLSEVLNQAAVVIHHGGDGTGQHALAVGRPQLVFPVHVSQILIAQIIHGMGVGNYVTGVTDPTVVTKELHLLLNQIKYTERAWAQACDIQSHHPGDGLTQVLNRCFQLLQQSVPAS